jgi:beta-alanine--pyruvate transaminase
MIGAIELDPIKDKPAARAFDVFLRCYEKGVLIRTTGDIIALSPPLIVENKHIDRIVETIDESLKEAA